MPKKQEDKFDQIWWCGLKVHAEFLVGHAPLFKYIRWYGLEIVGDYPHSKLPLFTPYIKKYVKCLEKRYPNFKYIKWCGLQIEGHYPYSKLRCEPCLENILWSKDFLNLLAKALCQQIKKRKLPIHFYDNGGNPIKPPEWLNYPYTSWTNEGAFNALFIDCHDFVVIKYLKNLCDSLLIHNNIDGYIYRNINSFLTERQKSHDPIGFLVAKKATSIIQGAIENSFFEIQTLDNDKQVKIINQTMLRFINDNNFCDNFKNWLDDALQKARGDKFLRERVYQTLYKHICLLRQEGIKQFKFGDLVKKMKYEIRPILSGEKVSSDNHKDEVEQVAEVEEIDVNFTTVASRIFNNDANEEDWEDWSATCENIIEKINNLPNHPKVINKILKVFNFLIKDIETKHRIPTYLELEKELGIPRATVGEAMQKIRDLFL
jgi:hypothetical protein